MSQTAVTTSATTLEVARQTGARLGNVFFQLNANLCWTETTLFSGTYDVVNAAGIPEPDNAPGAANGAAGALTGAYAYYVVMVDATREIMGNPSAQSSTVNPAGNRVTVDLTTITNEAANSRVTHFDIYRNLNGGTTYFFVARVTVATASYSDNNTDASISANDTLELDNNAPTAETYGIAKACRGYMFSLAAHNGIGGTTYEHDFIWSKLVRADNQPTVNRTKVEPGLYGRLVTAEPSGPFMVFYKERAIYELHFNVDPSVTTGDGAASTVNTTYGTVNDRCVVNLQGTHFVLGEMAIFVHQGGGGVKEIHLPLKAYWDRINWARKRWFSAAADTDRIYFFVALDGDTECRYCFVFDLNAWRSEQPPRWYVYEFDFGVRDCATFQFGPTGPNSACARFGMAWKRSVCVMTEFGYTGILATGFRDFVDYGLTAEGSTTAGGSTTTFIDTNGTFTRTNEASDTVNVVGAYVTFIHPNADKADSSHWDAAYRITAVGGTGNKTVTFTPALPEAPPTGTAYVIGRIPNARLYTPQLSLGLATHRKRAARIGLEFQPGGTMHTLGIEASVDRRAPAISGMTVDSSVFTATARYPGVNVKIGGSLSLQGRIGCQIAPPPGRGFYLLQLILDATGVDKPAIIDALLIDGITEEVKEGP